MELAVAPYPREHVAAALRHSRELIESSLLVIEDAHLLRAHVGQARRGLEANLETLHEKIDAARAWCTVPGSDGPGSQRAAGVKLAVWAQHVRYARTHDRRTLDALVREYRPYALGLARRMHRNGESLEDLQQVALEALVASLERFDPGLSIPFLGFATPTITGSLKRHFRDRGYAVRLPRRLQEIDAAGRAARDELRASLGREPSDDEVAAASGVPVPDLREAAHGVEVRHVTSLDAEVGDARQAQAASPDRGLLRAENLVALRQALVCLDDRDREILGLYYFEELSQQAIARRFGVSQMQVSRWIASSLKRLRSHLCVD